LNKEENGTLWHSSIEISLSYVCMCVRVNRDETTLDNSVVSRTLEET